MNQPLIIFDSDGVLVESEPIVFKFLVEHCAASGLEISSEQAYEAFLGKPIADIARVAGETFGHEIAPIELLNFQIKLLTAFRTDLAPVEGISTALSSINLAKCVASSSNMARIRRSLSLTGLEDFFGEHVFSTDLVARGKPHPDVFLHAANVMGAAPEDAVVIEDSPAGIKADKAAGMRVIGYYGARHAAPAKLKDRLASLEPDLLIDDMGKLPHAIQTLMAKTH